MADSMWSPLFIFSSNLFLPELVDREQYHKNNKRSNHLPLVSIIDCNFHIGKKTDRLLWAFLLLLYVCNQGT